MVLFINACVRKQSRTRKLADRVLSKLEGEVKEIRLHEMTYPTVDEAFLQERDRLIDCGEFANPLFDLARQFAWADQIVIAAHFWDLSFPASLKR